MNYNGGNGSFQAFISNGDSGYNLKITKANDQIEFLVDGWNAGTLTAPFPKEKIGIWIYLAGTYENGKYTLYANGEKLGEKTITKGATGLMNADRTPSPELYEVKKVHQEVSFYDDGEAKDGKVRIVIEFFVDGWNAGTLTAPFPTEKIGTWIYLAGTSENGKYTLYADGEKLGEKTITKGATVDTEPYKIGFGEDPEFAYLAGTSENGKYTLYADGEKLGEKTITKGATVDTEPYKIGFGEDPEFAGRRFNGLIDGVRVLNIANADPNYQPKDSEVVYAMDFKDD